MWQRCYFSVVFKYILMYLQHGLFTVIHKHHSPEAWKQFANENKDVLQVIVCISLEVKDLAISSV